MTCRKPCRLFGYLGYDMIRLLSNTWPNREPRSLGLADAMMVRPR